MQYIGKKEDEFFAGNIAANKDMTYLKNIKYRIGEQALDIHGGKINKKYMLPLFIKNSDATSYDIIMTNRQA